MYFVLLYLFCFTIDFFLFFYCQKQHQQLIHKKSTSASTGMEWSEEKKIKKLKNNNSIQSSVWRVLCVCSPFHSCRIEMTHRWQHRRRPPQKMRKERTTKKSQLENRTIKSLTNTNTIIQIWLRIKMFGFLFVCGAFGCVVSRSQLENKVYAFARKCMNEYVVQHECTQRSYDEW